jgi:tetratricopeptide (TPR) repeat protein
MSAHNSARLRSRLVYPQQSSTIEAAEEVSSLATDLDLLERDKEAFASHNDLLGEANVLNLIGFVEERNGRFEEAVEIHMRALALFREVGDLLGIGDSLNDVGVALGRLGRGAEAMESHEEALRVRQGNNARVSNSNSNLGVLLARKSPEKAREHFTTAAKLARSEGDTRGLGKIVNNSAVLDIEMASSADDLERVYQQFELSLALRDASRDQRGNAKTRNNLGIVQSLRGNLEGAQVYFGEAAALAGNVEDNVGLLHVLENWLLLIDAHRALSEPRKRIAGRIEDLGSNGLLPLRSVLTADCEAYPIAAPGIPGADGQIALLSSGSATPATARELRDRLEGSHPAT